MQDTTCPGSLAPAHASSTAREAGAVAVDAEYRKSLKYSHLTPSHCFIPVAVETKGVVGKEACHFKEVIQWVKVTHRQSFGTPIPCADHFNRGNAASVLG